MDIGVRCVCVIHWFLSGAGQHVSVTSRLPQSWRKAPRFSRSGGPGAQPPAESRAALLAGAVRYVYNTLVFVNRQFLINFKRMLIFSRILPLALCVFITSLTRVQHSRKRS